MFAGLFLFDLLADEDRSGLFTLRLEFRDVRGLKPGADVRYRGVPVGAVRDVGLSGDGEKGLVTILLEDDGARLARQSSRFWVVVPRFSGLTAGATGLETLVRDAYIAFLTPEPIGAPLAPSSLVAGLERPFVETRGNDLEPVHRGDLLMTVLVAENHGLHSGADVQLRGMTVGDVRSVELAADGSHVLINLRIHESYRKTVTDQTAFWVARPRLSGALLRGIAVEDIGALLSPYVGYHTDGLRGTPVPDGYRVAAAEDRPDIDLTIPGEALRIPPVATTLEVLDRDAIRIVEIVYEVEERDWFSANDVEHRQGTGVLFVDQAGRPVVVTTRSLCDGTMFMSDTFGDPDIKSEAIRVVVPGAGVLRAGRTWVDPGGSDLALLLIEDAPPDLPATPSTRLTFEPDSVVPDSVWNVGDEAPMDLQPGSLPDVASFRGALLMCDGRVIGLLGQDPTDADTPARVPLDHLPATLRPGS